MADNETFAAMATLARTGAVVIAATKGAKCRRCPTVTDLNRRQLCPACAQKRRDSMERDTVDMTAPRVELTPPTTVASLMVGPSGRGGCGGDDMCHAQSAFSARANLDTLIKRVLKAEDFLHSAPRSDSGWSVYDRAYDGLAKLTADIRFHEGLLKDSFPDLVVEQIKIPPRLVRETAPAWLTV